MKKYNIYYAGIIPIYQGIIELLRNALENIPPLLWLYAAAGTIHVMKCDKDGQRAMADNRSVGYSQDSIVASIDVPSDGGDW